MIKLLKVKVHGRVQGVFFRYETSLKARELNLVGFARNEPDGTVYIEAQGKEEKLKELLHWLEHHGPPAARIIKAEAKFSRDLKNFESFKIF